MCECMWVREAAEEELKAHCSPHAPSTIRVLPCFPFVWKGVSRCVFLEGGREMGGREGVGKEDGRHSHSHTHSHSTLTLTLTKRTSWHRFSLFCGCWVSNTFCCVVNWRERGASFLAQLGRHLSLQASKPKKKRVRFPPHKQIQTKSQRARTNSSTAQFVHKREASQIHCS